ncbi:MAG: hypothetical protein WAK95_16920 [Desulfobacterales bacterium]
MQSRKQHQPVAYRPPGPKFSWRLTALARLALLLMMASAAGCYSFGRGVASRALESMEREDTRQCEIRGSLFGGISSLLEDQKIVKILIVHGIGTHRPGHATTIIENISGALGLTVFSRPKNVNILNPADPQQRLSNLRIMGARNEDGSQKVFFYELTWSDITTGRKRLLDFDTSGDFAQRRAPFNNAMKAFLNDVAPDPIIFFTDQDNPILAATWQAVCWMLADQGDESLTDNQSQVCRASSITTLSNLEKYNIAFITHSLGSRIVIDALGEVVEMLEDEQIRAGHPDLVAELQAKEMTVFMLSNQLALLQIGLPAPRVVGQIDDYCREDGGKRARRAFNKLNIVAFTDPNDLFSYAITSDFVDNYLDSRMCPVVTNININVANRITAFGLEVVNPIAAHSNYHLDERVIELISHGNADLEENERLAGRCRMIRIENKGDY